jgi:hypothetical protein
VKSLLRQNKKLRLGVEKPTATRAEAEIGEIALKAARRQIKEEERLRREMRSTDHVPGPVPGGSVSRDVIQVPPTSSSASASWTSLEPPIVHSPKKTPNTGGRPKGNRVATGIGPTGKWEFNSSSDSARAHSRSPSSAEVPRSGVEQGGEIYDNPGYGTTNSSRQKKRRSRLKDSDGRVLNEWSDLDSN